MVQYTLAKAFPEFVRTAPPQGISVAFRILNGFAVSHVRKYLREGKTIDDITEVFSFRGKQRTYIRDLSVSWREVLRGEEKDLGEEVQRYLADPGNGIDPTAAVELAATHAAAASTWSILLEAGAELPASYAQPLFELAVARPVQLGSDTLQSLGSFVEVAAPYWDEQQRLKFEESVLALGSHGAATPARSDDGPAHAELVRDRLLARIPRALLVSAAARARIDELAAHDALPTNEPLVKYSISSGPYGVAEWLADHGVDPRARENAPMLALADELRQFSEPWANKRPDQDSAAAALPLLSRAVDALSAPSAAGADPKVVEHVWTQLAAAACSVARSRPDSSTPAHALAKDVLLRASASSPPEVGAGADEEFTTPGWSPTPRTEAIQGLGYLAEVSDDPRVAETFTSFMSAKDPAERYLAVRHAVSLRGRWLGRLWATLEQHWAAESNPVVLTTMLDTIARVGGGREPQGLQLLREIVSHWVAGSPMRCERSSDVAKAIARALGYLAWFRQEQWAILLVAAATKTLPGSFKLFEALTYDAVEEVTPAALIDPASEAPTRRIVRWLVDAIEELRVRVGTLSKSLRQTTAEREQELPDIHRLINGLVIGLYRNRDAIPQDRYDDGVVEAFSKSEKRNSPAFRAYYDAVLPLLRAILRFSDQAVGAGGMVAGTAHTFMQILNEFVALDPAAVVGLAAGVATAGGAAGYQLDPVAVREVVKLVEVILADHRDQITDGKPLEDTLRLLDVFADAGWPEAMRLVWRLDEVFR